MKKRIVIVILVLAPSVAACALSINIAHGQSPRATPKYVLVFRRPDLVKQAIDPTATIDESRTFQSLDEALKFAADADIDNEKFVGIWQLGEPLKVTLKESTETETVVHKKREWKRPQ